MDRGGEHEVSPQARVSGKLLLLEEEEEVFFRDVSLEIIPMLL